MKEKLRTKLEDAYLAKAVREREKTFSRRKALSHKKVWADEKAMKDIRLAQNEIKKGKGIEMVKLEKKLGINPR